MLTGFQCETAAYITEFGELLCPDCFDRGDTLARPVIRYSLDEEQAARADGYEWPDNEDNPAQDVIDDLREIARVGLLNPLLHDADVANAEADALDEAWTHRHDGCEPALYCDEGGEALLPEYHDHDTDEPQNFPAARWVPCSSCGAGDGQVHREDCSTLAVRVS